MVMFRRRSSRSRSTPPSTSPASEFERAQYPILTAPFHGAVVSIMVRELTQAQILSCGDFSLIETFRDRVARKRAGNSNILAYAEIDHALLHAALVHPTYDEIMGIFDGDAKVAAARSSLDDMRRKLKDAPQGPERAALEKSIDGLRVWADLVLPEDFLLFVLNYALATDKSDIRLVSEEMLISAAVLAERGHDNPADHIGGIFTDFMRDDINARAWVLLNEKREEGKRHAG